MASCPIIFTSIGNGMVKDSCSGEVYTNEQAMKMWDDWYAAKEAKSKRNCISSALNDEDYEAFKEYCTKHGIRKSALIRAAVLKAIKGGEKDGQAKERG